MSKTFLVTGLAAVTLSFPVVANAQVCTTDQDCVKGWTCKVSTTKSTAQSRPCADGKDCAPTPEETSYTPQSYCEPRECQANADCPEGMVCHGNTSTACKGSASVKPCPADAPDCKPTVVEQTPTCTTETTYRCAYTWQLPCTTNTDCGVGFVCEPNKSTSCSKSGTGGATGSSDSSGSSSGSTTIDLPITGKIADGISVPPSVKCETTTTFPGNCILEQATCKVDTDCPASWTCKETAAIVPSPDAQPGVDDGSGPTIGGRAAIGGAMSKGGAVAIGGTMPIGGTTAIGGTAPIGGTTAIGGAMATGGTMAIGGAASTGAIMANDDLVPPSGGSVTGNEPVSTPQAGSSSSDSPPPIGGKTTTGGGSSGIGGSSGGSVTTTITDVGPIGTFPQMVCVSPLGIGYGWRGQTVATVNESAGTVTKGSTDLNSGPSIILPPTPAPISPDPISVTTTSGSGESAKAEAGGGCSLGQGSQGGLTGLFLLGFVGLFLSRLKTRR